MKKRHLAKIICGTLAAACSLSLASFAEPKNPFDLIPDPNGNVTVYWYNDDTGSPRAYHYEYPTDTVKDFEDAFEVRDLHRFCVRTNIKNPEWPYLGSFRIKKGGDLVAFFSRFCHSDFRL